ncbi:MAG: hypothetical protein LBQ59_00705 [Candidatus Peribacteria bacterium]|jgi:hypothetical protein|nr:hypothetical protein [Candidatus Peribacteria bacterium]
MYFYKNIKNLLSNLVLVYENSPETQGTQQEVLSLEEKKLTSEQQDVLSDLIKRYEDAKKIVSGYIKPRISVREMQLNQAMRSAVDVEDTEEISRIRVEVERLKKE